MFGEINFIASVLHLIIYLQNSFSRAWAWSNKLWFHLGTKCPGFSMSQNTHNEHCKLQRKTVTLLNIQKKVAACQMLRWLPDQGRVKQCVSFLLPRPLGWLIIADCELFRDLDFYYSACTGSIAVGPLLTCSISAMTYAMVNGKNIILKIFPSFSRQSPHRQLF